MQTDDPHTLFRAMGTGRAAARRAQRIGVALAVAGGAAAATSGATVTASSMTNSGFSFGAGAFDTPVSLAGGQISDQSLMSIHQSLAADGVDTDGFVTILATQTLQGLAILALMDCEDGGGVEATGQSSFIISSRHTRPGAAASPSPVTLAMNDSQTDLMEHGSLSGSTTALFNWDADGSGDAMAWAGLQGGDSLSLTFVPQTAGLDRGYQFLTWSGSSWSIERFFAMNSHIRSVDFAVGSVVMMPLPTPAMLGAAGLAGVVLARRGRRPLG